MSEVEIWRPLRIGVFWYASLGARTSRRNFVMREDCAAYCARLNRGA